MTSTFTDRHSSARDRAQTRPDGPVRGRSGAPQPSHTDGDALEAYGPIAGRLIAAETAPQHMVWRGRRRRVDGRVIGEYSGGRRAAVPIGDTLPTVPAAALLFAPPADNPSAPHTEWLARTFPADFDAKRGRGQSLAAWQRRQRQAAREADDFAARVRRCGLWPVTDVAPGGGRHVYAVVAPGDEFTADAVAPLVEALARRYATFDPASPLKNRATGCITYPGTAHKHGGRRELVGITPSEMVERLTQVNAAPGALARLADDLCTRLGVDEAAPEFDDPRSAEDVVAELHDSGTVAGTVLPPELRVRTPLPAAQRRFAETGEWPSTRRRGDGTPWTNSEATQSLLEHLVMRGWSADRIWKAFRNWPGPWQHYAQRRNRRADFDAEFARAYQRCGSAARARCARPVTKSANPDHLVAPTAHTGGGAPPGTRHKQALADARAWVLTHPDIERKARWSALLVVTALARGCALRRASSTWFGARWIADTSGLSLETVHETLRLLTDLDGSPVLLVCPWTYNMATGEVRGDEYALVTPKIDGRPVRASWWEIDAARLDPIDPVWRHLGSAAWWTYQTMVSIDRGATGLRLSPKVLAAAGRVSRDTIERGLKVLAAEGLVDTGHGWAARTGRSPRRLDITAEADELAQTRRERHQRERREFQVFLGIVAAEWPKEVELIERGVLDRSWPDPDDADYAACIADLDRRGPPPEPDDLDERERRRARITARRTAELRAADPGSCAHCGDTFTRPDDHDAAICGRCRAVAWPSATYDIETVRGIG